MIGRENIMMGKAMTGQKRIYDMTDRELRTYKRKLRRRREQRRRIVSVLMAFCLIAMCVISYRSLTSSASDNTEEVSLKYYTGIMIESGDNLWEIADNYIDYARYKNKEAYIKEVCSINRLADSSEIYAGQRLIVPYYSVEYIK